MNANGKIYAFDHRPRRGQLVRILARLQRGPATREELLEIAHYYRGRISELRARGFAIVCDRSDPAQPRYTLLGKRVEFGNLELL